ncbi:lysophospholipid acyltransferase 5-like [Glandiceps talaboti]
MAVFAVDASPIAKLAELTGIQENGLRLLISVLLGYPLAAFQRAFLHGKSPLLHHIYFIVIGLFLAQFNYGQDSFHFIFCIGVTYLLVVLIGGTTLCVVITFIFNMMYLLIAYVYTATDIYDVIWTTPHCVLCLRLIGIAFDVYDGALPLEQLSADQKTTAMNRKPTLIEFCGYSMYFGCFFAGPTLPIRRYLDMCEGGLTDGEKGDKPNCVWPAIDRFLWGVLLSVFTMVSTPYMPTSYMHSDEFGELPFWRRIVTVAFYGQVFIGKYLPVWVFAEGTCILSGLGYNGKDKDGKTKWNACANIDIYYFMTAITFRDLIKGFNLSTNLWVFRYIYKRLKFLNNKLISQCVTVFFLAIWHGFFAGYFMCFMLEVFITRIEMMMVDTCKMLGLDKLYENPVLKVPMYIIGKMWLLVFIGYPLIGFGLLTYAKMVKSYNAIYWCGHIFYCFAYPALYIFILKPMFGKPRKKEKESVQEGKGKTE